MGWVLGSDIGGTFTDIVLAGPSGEWTSVKQLTTPEAPERAVIAGAQRAIEQAGVDPREIARVVHGTTLATNAVIERRGARAAFVTTAGFGDLLHIGRNARVEEDRYDLHFTAAPAPLSRSLVFEVNERMDARGAPVRELSPEHARDIAAQVERQAPESVAVCFLHAYANPAHEEQMATALEASLPGTRIVLSSRVHPELREFDRACTTLFTAEVAPLMARYLAQLESDLRALGITAPLQVMESSGGVMAASVAAERAVATLESGGAAGVMAAARFARHHGLERAISLDMGGTTVKAGVIHEGQPRLARELHVGGKGSFGGRRAGTGMPVKTPTVDIAELGAGGGSIAWIDPEGLLQVGPRSAGAAPGPACYGQGGDQPTVTDANLILGYLDPERFGSGQLVLDLEAARRALADQVAGPLGISIERAAVGVHEAANASLASAIHVVTVQRGLDPRTHTLVSFGGAGPMHMAGVADRFGILRGVVPPRAGVAAAIGMQGSDLQAELGRSVLMRPEELTLEEARDRFHALEVAALQRMGLPAPPPDLEVERIADVRFEGQAHEFQVPLTGLDAAGLDGLDTAFRQRYVEAYGVASEGRLEYAALRVRLRVPVTAPPLPRAPRGESPVARTHRTAHFGDSPHEAAVFDRSTLPAGGRVDGPAIIEGEVETLVVPPGWCAEVDPAGSLLLERLG
jgi:N-methylhydantoinase A